DVCAHVFSGSAKPGDPCTVTTDCVAGATCDPIHASAAFQCRSRATGALGDRCFESEPSDLVRHVCPNDSGLFCDLGTYHCTA
ncbi:hypothetical protein, partial [Staphylococcus aureus]